MRTNNFNKSAIMKRAWNCYCKHSATMTFGQCLSWSWKKAWEELRKNNHCAYAFAIIRKEKEHWKKFDQRIKQVYRNVVVGRNDWCLDYGRRYAGC